MPACSWFHLEFFAAELLGETLFSFSHPPLIVHVRLGIQARDGRNCKTYRVIFFVFLSCFLLLGGNGSGDHSNLTKLFYWVEASGKPLPDFSLHRLPLSNSGTVLKYWEELWMDTGFWILGSDTLGCIVDLIPA